MHEKQRPRTIGWLDKVVLGIAAWGFVVLVVWAWSAIMSRHPCKCPADLEARLMHDEWDISRIENCVEGVNDEALDAQADATWCKAKIDEQRQLTECLRTRLDAMEEWKPWLLWASQNLKPCECECCQRTDRRK